MTRALCYAFVAALLLLPLANAQQDPTALSSSSPPNEQALQSQMALLREGMLVKLKLLHTLNSKTVVVDDPLNFAVAEDVVVDGNVLIKAGSPAIGQVWRAKPARTLGRGAELRLQLDHVRAGAVRVPLRGSLARKGKDKTGETVALVVVFGLSGFVKHGTEIEMKEGSTFDAFVDQDTAVPVSERSTNVK